MPPKKEIIIEPLFVSSAAQSGSRKYEPKYEAVGEVAKSMVSAVKSAEMEVGRHREGSLDHRKASTRLKIANLAAKDSYNNNWQAYQQAAKEEAKAIKTFPIFRDLPVGSYRRGIPSVSRRRGPRTS